MGMYTPICGGFVKIICFVLDNSYFAGDYERMGKATRDIELNVIFGSDLGETILFEGW